MPLDRLERIVAEIDRWPTIRTIWYFGFGEPLLHPQYRECLEILGRSRVASAAVVVQNTNASLLSGARAEAILDVPVINRLALSFDGDGAGPREERVLAEVRAFAAMAATRRPDLRIVTDSITLGPGQVPGLGVPPQEEAGAGLKAIFEPLGITVNPRALHDYSGGEGLQISARRPGAVWGGCPFVERDSLYLTVDGRAQPCCAVYDPQFNLGHIEEADFGTLLNGEEARALRHSLRLDQRAGLRYCRDCTRCLGNQMSEDELRTFWTERDDMGAADEQEERAYLFGSMVPTPHRERRLDLGCGPSAAPGFIGVDRFALPGVNVVADFDRGLPFADSSFDLIVASHSLEHAADLPALMREVYRVAKDRAQVVVIAPYAFTSTNVSNPYHLQAFTEESARFWTDSPTAPAECMEEVWGRHVMPEWGLIRSDHSEADIDLRCLRLDFFYAPEYRALSREEQRRLRHSQLNVCDQIAYHLLAVKSPLREGEEEDTMRTMEFHEPPYLMIRRRKEIIEHLQAALEARTRELEVARAAERQRAEALEANLRELEVARTAERQWAVARPRLAELEEEICEAQAALQTAEGQVREEQERLSQARGYAQELQEELAQSRGELVLSREQAEGLRGEAETLREGLRQAVLSSDSRAAGLRNATVRLEAEWGELSRSRVVRWLDRWRPGRDWRASLTPEFQQLLDDSLLFGGGLDGYVLRPSAGLTAVPFVAYELTPARAGWSGVTIAPLFDAPGGPGELVVEVVSPQGEIVAHARVPAAEAQDFRPLRVTFPPIVGSDQGTFELRVAAVGTQGEVRVFEWRRPSLAGLRPCRRRPLCAVHFA
jgi:SAM-dependent methyltransferase